MTSADTLIEAILFEAHETAEKIIQDVKKKVQDTLEEQKNQGRERARERVIAIDKKARNDSVIIKLRDIASTESKAKWLILEKKHELIEKVLKQVKDELHTRVKTDKYIQVLENLIVEGGIVVGATSLEVILNARDSNLPLDLDKLAEKIYEKTGNKTKITKSERNVDVIGGAIIQTTGEDIYKDFYDKNLSLKLISESNTITKFREVATTFFDKQTLPNIEDDFKLKVLKDILNNFKIIATLEDRISEFSTKSTTANNLGSGKIVLDSTFEAMLKNFEREIRNKITQILFT